MLNSSARLGTKQVLRRARRAPSGCPSPILRAKTHQRHLTGKTSSQAQQTTGLRYYLSIIRERPIEYATVPCVAAFVGIMTNWMGVKMLFYPIEYWGFNVVERPPFSPYGYFGWQGVVPTKTEAMAKRLVKIVTEKLLSLQEAFGRLQPAELSTLLMPAVSDQILTECGPVWHALVKPVLPMLLPIILQSMNNEIDGLLNLRNIVLEAFLRDKEVLVELFQKVGTTWA